MFMQQQVEKPKMKLTGKYGLILLAGACAAVGLGGCAVTPVADVPPAKTFHGPPQKIPSVEVTAGTPVRQGDNSMIIADYKAFKVTARPDPFALRPFEQEHEAKENNERIFATTGSFFGPLFVPKPESVQVERVEPQPFRRLAGVLVGDSVIAIIDMGDGSPMQVIRPGMQIPNSPWRVVSIDSDKAILRRSGFVKPTEVVVRLQSPAFNGGPAAQPTGQGQAPGQGGQQQQPPGGGGRFGRGGGGAAGGGGGGIN